MPRSTGRPDRIPLSDLMTVEQLMAELGWSRKTIYNKVSLGTITRVKVHGRLRFLRSDIEQIIAQDVTTLNDLPPAL